MKVILLSDIRQRGKRGEVVEVKAGYARNFLLPQGLALVATSGNLKYFEQQRKKIDAKHTEQRDAAAAIAAQLSGLKVIIAKRVGETQTMYGSVKQAWDMGAVAVGVTPATTYPKLARSVAIAV